MDYGITLTSLIQIAIAVFLFIVKNNFATEVDSPGTACVSDRGLVGECIKGVDCDENTTVFCLNGECSEDGRCICLPCWQGRSCNISANANPPVVNYGDIIKVSIPADQPPYEVFLNIEATDSDKDPRCADVACPCVDTMFSLQQDDVDDDIFHIKSSGSRGAMFLMSTRELKVGRVYDVTMTVSNTDEQQSTDKLVKVQITPPLGFDAAYEDNVALSRSRRAAVSSLDVNDTVLFTLDVLSPTPTNITNITAGTHVDVQLTIAIPPAVQIDSMSFEFFAENNVSSFGVVCQPEVKDYGSSISYEEASPGLDFNAENYFQAETSYLTLTNITNANEAAEDHLSLEFGVTIVNDDNVKFGELNWISVGAEFLDFSRIWVGQVGFFIAPKEEEVVASPRLQSNGTTSINSGESGVMSLFMNIYKHSYNLSVSARISPTTGYHVCKFGLRTTGKGYCLENADRGQSFTVDSMTGYNTEAFFDFKEVIYGGENNDEDSLIVMDLFIQLADDATVVGTSYTVTFDVSIDGALSTTSSGFVGADGVTATKSPFAPSFDVSFPELTNGFSYTLNELLELDITFTFPVGVYGDATVDFQIQGQSIQIPVYSVDVVKTGYNIGCFETCTTFKTRDVCPLYANLVDLFKPITNRGLRFWASDNDVTLRTMLRFGDIPLGNQTITATLAVDATNLVEATLVVDIMQRSPVTPVLPRSFTSTTDQLTILSTETGSHVINIVLEPASEFFYTLEFNSNVDWFTIKNVTTVTIGKDVVGGLNDLIPFTDFSAGNYKATFELGFINNIALFSNETTDEDSTISLEVVVGVNDTVSVENGAEATVNVTIVVSDAAPTPTVDQSLLSLTVTAMNETISNITSKFKLECPSESSDLRPGEIVACTVAMNFTDLREFVIFDVETSPNTTEAVGLMILSVTVLGIGGNLQITGSQSATMESSQNNSQIDRGTIDFGFITNTGISNDPADDEVIFEIQVQATDTEGNVNGTQLLLGTGASVSDKLVWVAYTTFYINRNGKETPQLNCSFFSLDDIAVDEQLHLRDSLTYAATIQHDQGSSSAEAMNVTATFFLPPYFTYESTSAILDHMVITSGRKLIVSIPRLYFNDVINFTVSVSVDCTHIYNLKTEWVATTLLEITYHALNRDTNGVVDSADPLSNVIKYPIKLVSFGFRVKEELVSNEGRSPICLSPTDLGMESGQISNCQIYSSQETDPVATAADARRNGASGWKVGKSGPFAGRRWLKVDIGRLSSVTMIQTQGGSGTSFEGDIGEYEVFYSKDDLIYRRAFHMNGSDTNPVFDHRKGYPNTPPIDYYDLYSTYFFHRPIEARFVIIRLREDNATDGRLFNVLRFELYGCFLEEQQLDICDNRNETEIRTLPEEYDRGFVVDTSSSTLYVCSPTVDDQPGLSEGVLKNTYLFRWRKRTTRCFKTTDTYKWQSLSDSIHNVIGYSPITGGVYGIAGYASPVYVVSFDGGVEWSEITNDQFAEASTGVGYLSYNELPLESTDSFNFIDGDITFMTRGSFEATFNGFKGNRGGSQQKIFDWNSCCQN